MAKKKSITVEGTTIALIQQDENNDFISLTDIMKRFDDEFAIYSWMRNQNTVEFLGVWEQLHNPNFKGNEFVRFKNQAGANSFNLTPKKWITSTQAIGMIAKSGRYGGTYAHRDIAINFCYWLSPTFQLYLIKEFQRLKDEEARRIQQGWDYRRFLSKVNYQLHTDTIKDIILPRINAPQNRKFIVYAEEADMLNLAVFGMTARHWKEENPDLAKKGNMRDYADVLQLTILANLESMNAILIEQGMHKEQRFEILVKAADSQYRRLANNLEVKKLDSKK